MAKRQQVHCHYLGYPRVVCPVILGHTDGREVASVFQVGGGSKSGLPPDGEWRCFYLSGVSDVRLQDGPWYDEARHERPQRCVKDVDLDVNPASPYNPRRRFTEI